MLFNKIIISIITILTFFIYNSSFTQTLNAPTNLPLNIGNSVSDSVLDQKFVLTENQVLKRKKIVEEEYSKETDLEKFYSKRASEKLELQGYDFFKNSFGLFNDKMGISNGASQENYILNSGDQLLIVMQGGRYQNIKPVIKDKKQITKSSTKTHRTPSTNRLPQPSSEFINKI